MDRKMLQLAKDGMLGGGSERINIAQGAGGAGEQDMAAGKWTQKVPDVSAMFFETSDIWRWHGAVTEKKIMTAIKIEIAMIIDGSRWRVGGDRQK